MSDSEHDTESYNSDNDSEYYIDEEGGEYPTVGSDSDSEEGDGIVKPKINIGAEIKDSVLDNELDLGGADYDSEAEEEEQEEEEEKEEYQTDGDEATEQQVAMPAEIQSQSETEEEEDSSEEEEEEDENYLKKFDREVISNYVDVYHPESRMHNYDEVRTLSSVIRGTNGEVVDELHRTLPFLTKFEKARVLGLRAKQIDEGAQPFVKVPSNVVTGYTISLMELEQKKIPFIIRRPIPGGGSEYWKVSDLELII